MSAQVPAIGDVFAESFRIDGRLGRGGFGLVYRATELSTDTPVALKVLSPSHLEGVGADRFRREAELASRLTHPNTVRVLHHGTAASGVPFIAFELLHGESLQARLDRDGALAEDRVAQIAIRMLEALAEAHALGIVHRDIKPSNVFLCDYAGHRDFVKVLDFGIAKRGVKDATQLTANDMVIGTPRYMSPAQLKGEIASAADDLYSLGLMMAELITGSPVIDGQPVQIYLAQMAPEPLSLTSAVKLSRLSPVIQRAIEKDIRLRYTNAGDMLADIHSALGRGSDWLDETENVTQPDVAKGSTLNSVPPAPEIVAPAPPPTPRPSNPPAWPSVPPPMSSPADPQQRAWVIASLLGAAALMIALALGIYALVRTPTDSTAVPVPSAR